MLKDEMGSEIRFSGCTDVGRVRIDNEDRILMNSETAFFAVSDGMGRLPYGAETAEMVCARMDKEVQFLVRSGNTDEKAILAAMEQISNDIFALGNEEGKFRYGATFSGVKIFQDKIVFINMGDSRGYLILKKNGELKQVTVDHNLAELYVSKGYMTYEEAKARHLESRLTNFIGADPHSVGDMHIIDRKEVAGIMLCTDGMYSMVSEAEMIKYLASEDMPPQKICETLVDLANEAGGRDNISVIYIRL